MILLQVARQLIPSVVGDLTPWVLANVWLSLKVPSQMVISVAAGRKLLAAVSKSTLERFLTVVHSQVQIKVAFLFE